jgi:glycosyltransferase involved in cell wall biosynthesis
MSKKLKIAFIADPLDQQYGGIHVYLKEILRKIDNLKTEHSIYIIRAKAKNDFSGIKEIILPWSSFPGYRAWRIFVEIPRILIKMNVDVVIEPAHFGPFNLPKKIKRITVIHDMTTFLFPNDHLFFSQFLQRKFLPFILKRADYIITNSQNTSADLVQFFPFCKRKNKAVLLGKNQRFYPRRDRKVLAKYEINQAYFLHVGTLEPRKNIPFLIQAFNQFKALTGTEHQLILIGKKGWKYEQIFQEIDAAPFRDSIKVLGYLEEGELPVFYSMATAFVFPSKYEGFGLPLLEAMSCGAPIITSQTSSLGEVGGAAALYFKQGSVENLAQKLEQIVKNEWLQLNLRRKSKERAASFSWKETAKQTIKIIENVTN